MLSRCKFQCDSLRRTHDQGKDVVLTIEHCLGSAILRWHCYPHLFSVKPLPAIVLKTTVPLQRYAALYHPSHMRARADLRKVSIVSSIVAGYAEPSKGVHTNEAAVGLLDHSMVSSADEQAPRSCSSLLVAAVPTRTCLQRFHSRQQNGFCKWFASLRSLYYRCN